MDPIADMMAVLRVEGVCYGRLISATPEGFRCESGAHAHFGIVSQGFAWLVAPDLAEPVALYQGDFILLAPGREYELRGAPTNPANLIGGRFSFDPASGSSLAEWLPPVILIREGDARKMSLEKTLALLSAEVNSPGPGSQLLRNRLADVLFIQVLRAYISSTESPSTGWLRALSDAQIGATLRSMHEQLDHPWTVASLASTAGMSRSAFAQRFKELVGDAPVDYLTRWRMYKASRLLRESDKKLMEIAQSVGYDSDGAFHKAFKRVLGIAPGEYRRAFVQN